MIKFFFSLLFITTFSQNLDILSLNRKWNVHSPSNESIHIQGTVPGYIHTDLFNSKVIEDPYYRFNDIEYRWISAVNWTYERSFQISKISQEMLLWCDGVDTIANISINGKQVGYTNNQFKRYIFPIHEYLKIGENIIQFKFTSAMHYSSKKRREYPYHVPHDYHIFSNGEQNRNFIRKSQCSFSWDWGPCFLPVGIWRDIKIVGYDNYILKDFIPRTTDKSLYVRIIPL